MQRSLREDVRNTERMIEVPVADEEIPGAGLRRHSPPDIERETRRVNTEPGLLPRDRVAFDRHLSQLHPEGVPERGAGGRSEAPVVRSPDT